MYQLTTRSEQFVIRQDPFSSEIPLMVSAQFGRVANRSLARGAVTLLCARQLPLTAE